MKVYTVRPRKGAEYQYLQFRLPVGSEEAKMALLEMEILKETPQMYAMRVFRERREKRY